MAELNMALSATYYLAYATGGHEFEVAEALTHDNYDVWCGRRKKRIRGKKGSRMEDVPALPNCLVLKLTDQQWHEIRSGKIIYYFTDKNDKPKHKDVTKHLSGHMMTLSARDVRQFREFQERLSGNQIDDNDPFAAGQDVTITEGPFADLMAKVRSVVEGGQFVNVDIEAGIGSASARLPIGSVEGN